MLNRCGAQNGVAILRVLGSKLLDKIAQALLEYETLSGDEIINVIQGVMPKREEPESHRALGPTVAVPISPRPGPEPA